MNKENAIKLWRNFYASSLLPLKKIKLREEVPTILESY